MTAMKKICPYTDRSCCVGCQYEISTKSTMLLMVAEVKRLSALYKTSDYVIQKNDINHLQKI
jgi:hypothetical protein